MPGPSHAPFRALLRAFALGVLMAAPLASLTACDAVEGTTPQCEPNVDSNGIHPKNIANGCHQFAVCRDESGNPQDPETYCCAGLTELDLQYCMYTYGADEPPYKGGSSSSTSGTGGSGGGAGTGGSGGAPAN